MKIPMGNFGQQVAQPGQAPQFSPDAFGAAQGAADQQLGQAEFGLAAQDHAQQVHEQDTLAKTSALVAYQTHQTNTKIALQDASEQLGAGAITPDVYRKQVNDAVQQSWQSTVGALPDSEYKNIASIENQGLQARTNLAMSGVLRKNTQQQIAANVGTLLDNAGKDISVDPGNIQGTITSARAAFFNAAPSAGIAAPKAQEMYTKWENEQYFQHATRVALDARESGDPTALDTLEHNLKAADGFYAGKMNPQQTNQVLSTVVGLRASLQNQADAQRAVADEQGRTAYNQAIDVFGAGKQFSPDYQAALAKQTAGTPYEAAAQKLITDSAHSAAFVGASLPQMEAQLRADEAGANTPGQGTDPETLAVIKQRRQWRTEAVQAYKENPWQAAQERGAIQQIPPIDTSSVGGLIQSLGQRLAAVGTVEEKADRKVSLLTPDEAQAALKVVNSLPIDAQAQALNGIGGVYQQAGRISDLANQWHDKDPSMALALKAGAGGGNGNPLMTTSGNPVSAFILAGAQALKDKTVKVDDTISTGLRGTIANSIDGTLPPEQAQDAKEMAYYIALGSAARNGRSNGVPSAVDIQNGIDAATGGISTTGGTDTVGTNAGKPNRVAMPYGWNEGDFQSAVKSATAANIENTVNGKPVDTVYANGTAIPVDQFMSKFPSYRLMRVGVRGSYAVQAGGKFVSDASGNPISVHLTRGKPSSTAAAESTDSLPNPLF